MLLTSCAKETVQEDGRPIFFTLLSDSTDARQTDSVGTTRAADGINNEATFVYPAMFTVAVDGDNRIYTATAFNTVMTSSAPASFPVDGHSVRVQAFYPAFLMHYSATPQTFIVAQNQSQTSTGTDNYRDSDLMYGEPQAGFADLDGSGKVKPTTNVVPLVFDHKMVKVRIDVAINSGVKVKRITMKNVKRAIDFDTENVSFSSPASAADGLGDNVVMYNNASGTTAGFTCTALIPKQDLEAGTGFIDVLIESAPNDVTLTYNLHEDANFASGKQYIYDLTVSLTEVTASCSIADWNNITPAAEFTQDKSI
ncbi:MAG: fimbrillin family protein [Prevotella sp.]|nr:fimbrillin family protein [Prevotella sp.]